MIEQKAVTAEHNEQSHFQEIPPQVRIYNRNFYLRNARHQALQQEVNKEIHQLSQKPKLTPNSYVILVQKLDQQIQSIYAKYLNKDQEIGFQHFQLVFNEIGKFIEYSKEKEQLEFELMITQLWLVLIHYDLQVPSITKNALFSLFHILFCPYSLKQNEIVSLIQHAFPDMQESRAKYMKKFPEASEQVLELDGLVKLWLKVKRNSLHSSNIQKKTSFQEEKLSFTPQINDKSRLYAQRSLQKYLQNNRLDNIKHSKLNQLSGYISGGKQLSYHQILYKRGLEKEQILKTSRQAVHHQSQKTLTSQQTKKLVENLYIIKEKKEDVDYQKIKEQQELKLCTFQPNTIQYHKRSRTPVVKNYEKQVQRLQKGRKEKQKLKEAYQNLGKVKQKKSGPPSFVERQKPKLILEIKLGDNIVKLGLKGDEQPRIVAKKFVIKHNLQQSMQQILEEVIQEQLAALQQ